VRGLGKERKRNEVWRLCGNKTLMCVKV
jgi:hypothetical protein